MRGIYAIVDVEILEAAALDPLTFARSILEAPPAALQLRAKNASARDTLSLLRNLAPSCKAANVPLVCNDRVDLAIAAGCDFVHLGQDDAPLAVARQLDAKLGVGLSTHTLEQVASALELRPDYIAYGPIFATASKKNHEAVVGISGLAAARALILRSAAPHTPLIAIGGITVKTAADVIAHADAIAVISAIVSVDSTHRMRVLHEAIGTAR